jgi:hypothetical protein
MGDAEVYFTFSRAQCEGMAPQRIDQTLQDRSGREHPLHDEVEECACPSHAVNGCK